MLQITNLHANVGEKPILKDLTLSLNAGEIHAIMGPNGAGKSTLGYVLSGRPGYEVTEGSVTFNGNDLLDLEPHERAAAGLFLGFQYPVEIPGVSNVQFLREALNAQRKNRGEAPLSGAEFLKVAREQAGALGMDMDMLKRPVNVGFSGGEKKRMEVLQMALLEPLEVCARVPMTIARSQIDHSMIAGSTRPMTEDLSLGRMLTNCRNAEDTESNCSRTIRCASCFIECE